MDSSPGDVRNASIAPSLIEYAVEALRYRMDRPFEALSGRDEGRGNQPYRLL